MNAGIFPEKSIGINQRMAAIVRSGHIPTMDLPSKLRRLMEEKGLNPFSIATRADLKEDTVRDIIRGKSKDPGAFKLFKVAQVLDTSVEELFAEEGEIDPHRRAVAGKEILLPVAHHCKAGAFLEEDELSQVEPRMEPAEFFPAYARWPQWLEVVDGDSIDKLIPPGALIHVVDALAMGYAPATDDIVVVQRSRLGGMLRERTVKQVELTHAGVKLWPRSHNPKYQAAIDVAEGSENEDGVTVTIVGKVLQAYIRFGRRD